MSDDDPREQLVELEIKLAYQDRKLGELEELVHTLVARLDTTERELAALKATLAPPTPINEPPPHY
ncbi:MAG TPA: SlyX family protein [Kofleriaceae bacterium]|nr:SlyX family protein [Kofleriaceae bacterium]